MTDSNRKHPGTARTSPYPVSRLSPTIGLVELAREISQADDLANTRLNAKLGVIAEQIRALQAQARAALEQARPDQDLHHARCGFSRKPGRIYHRYRRSDGVS
jgi:hypothetical protein